MISPRRFIEKLREEGVDFFTGVPDSLLKAVCAYITENVETDRHVIAANEGGAVALAAGHHLSSGGVGCVYMQNSGEGNAVNPLASLTDRDVYRIPLLLLIGWRGRPGVHDEPQHVRQGKITTGLLNVLGIDYEVLSKDEKVCMRQVERAMDYIRGRGEAFALVVEKDTFEDYALRSSNESGEPLGREEAVRCVAEKMKKGAVAVSTTGMISRELFEYRESSGEGHGRDFLTVGSMGHASMIALGVSMREKGRTVYCLDGDGAAIMQMGNMAIVAQRAGGNYVHVVFNNGAHDSVGGQPTVGKEIDLVRVALGLGYEAAVRVETREELEAALAEECKKGPRMIEVRVRKGHRADLGRPTSTPQENKEAFVAFLKE